MRENWLSNRIFKSFDAIVDLCCDAWNKLINQPWRISTGSNQRVLVLAQLAQNQLRKFRSFARTKTHRTALTQIEALWGRATARRTATGSRRSSPLLAIDPSFDSGDVLISAMDELGHTRVQLTHILGSRSRASEILARRRALMSR
jgi:hypothetical protein